MTGRARRFLSGGRGEFANVALLVAVAYLVTSALSDEFARAIVWAGALVALGIVLSPGERAIYSISTYDREERGRGAED